jgi:hypothetical protein
VEKRPKTFKEIRQDAEDAQRSILWPDNLRANRASFAFLWRGDPKAKQVQRAGLIIFGLFWLSCAYIWLYSFFHSDPEDRSVIELISGIVMGLFAARILRNAFLRPSKQAEANDRQS